MSRCIDRRALLGLVAVLSLTLSCDSQDDPGPVGPGNPQNETLSIAILPDSAEVFAGVGSQAFTATVRDGAGTAVPAAPITWTSSAGATVSPSQGQTTTATGVSAGRVTITATSGTASRTAVLLVKAAAAPQAPAPRNVQIATNGSLSQPAPGVLSGATLGTPAGTVVSFGGGVLGGDPTSYAAGQTAVFDLPVPGPAGSPPRASQAAQGFVLVSSDGSFTINPPAGFDGSFSFQFRIANVAGSADGTVNVAVDAPPVVVSNTPLDGATGVSATSTVAIVFSEPVTAPASALRLDCPAGTSVGFALAGSGTNQLTMTPAAPLPRGITCRVTVTGAQVRDADTDDGPDAMAADHTFSFTIESAVLPRASDDEYGVDAGATRIVAAPGVLGNDNLGSPAATLTSFGGGDVGGAITSHTPGTSLPLAGGTVRLNADGSLVISGLTEAGAYEFDYRLTSPDGMSDATVTIVLTPQDGPPVVSGSTPANGATGVLRSAPISVFFNEDVIVAPGAFQLECPAKTPWPFTMSGSGGEEIVLTPTTPMPSGTTCVVTVLAGPGVRDADSFDPPDQMEDSHQFSFTVGTAPAPVNDSYQTLVDTPLLLAAPGVLSNDVLGSPAGVISSFGGGSLGGSVTSNPVGAGVPFGVSGLAVLQADGALLVIPPIGFTGTVTFSYRVTGANGFADATVTIVVEAAPSVVSTTPLDAATGVPSTADVTITFSEPVNVTGDWLQAVCTTSGVRNVFDFLVTGGPTAFTLTPNVDFASGETCTATVIATQVADQDITDPPDVMAANYVFSFTVDAAPQVDLFSPADGAVNVIPGSILTVTFSEPVNVNGNWFQVVCGADIRNVANFLVAGGPTSFTMIPNSAFPQGTCTATVFAAQIADADAGDPPDNLASNVVWSFTVEAPPSVLSTSPANGSNNVPANSNLSITFSEAVFVANPLVLQCTGSGTLTGAAFVPIAVGPVTFTLDPIADFQAGETCTGTILAADVTDLDANDPPDNMLADFVFSFTVDAAPAEMSLLEVGAGARAPLPLGLATGSVRAAGPARSLAEGALGPQVAAPARYPVRVRRVSGK